MTETARAGAARRFAGSARAGRGAARSWVLAAGLALTCCHAGVADARDIDVRLSIKFIRNAAGNRPPGLFGSETAIQSTIASTNEVLRRFARGYQYVISEFQDVYGASQYYDLTGNSEFQALENSAEANPAQYFWRTNAANVFIVNSFDVAGGAAAIPSNPSDAGYELTVITAGMQPTFNWLHELSHHFDLIHTFNDDQVSDTLYDPEATCIAPFSCTTGGTEECCCTTKLSRLNAQGYSTLDHDNLLYNVMSYYGALDCVGVILPAFDYPTMRLTDGQLDRWTDATRRYAQLQGEVSGYSWFVDHNFGGTSNGFSTNPYKAVGVGVAAASAAGTDIVQVRGGVYPENLYITKPVTLRASRGTARIGQ